VRPQTRDDPSVKELEQTGTSIIEIDYLNEKTIVSAAEGFGYKALDLLINNAGLLTIFIQQDMLC